jgi:uncharacterized protein HemY
VELARKAVGRGPKQADYWNTLGAAYYRAGNPTGAVEAFEKAVALRNGGDALDWLFLAAARQRLGQTEAVRAARAEATARLATRPGARGAEFVRLRAELERAVDEAAAPAAPSTK